MKRITLVVLVLLCAVACTQGPKETWEHRSNLSVGDLANGWTDAYNVTSSGSIYFSVLAGKTPTGGEQLSAVATEGPDHFLVIFENGEQVKYDGSCDLESKARGLVPASLP